jgi:hypothetical protein
MLILLFTLTEELFFGPEMILDYLKTKLLFIMNNKSMNFNYKSEPSFLFSPESF